MLSGLMAWWLRQLRALVWGPTGRDAYARATVVRPDGDGLTVTERRRGREAAPERLQPGRPVRRGKVVLSLPPTGLLSQSVTLPLAAERDLGTILGHEMDRLTPFRAEDVFWAWRIERREVAAGRLRLRLLVAAKAGLAQPLAALAALGLHPAALEFGREHVLLSPGTAERDRRRAGWGAAVCAGLAVLLCAVPVLRQEWEIARTEGQAAALRPKAERAEAARRQIAGAAGGAGMLEAETARVGRALLALSALTDALPDDTSLTSLSLHDRGLTFAGRSAEAAKLIGRLSASPALRDPAFDAPVIRLSATADLFSAHVRFVQ